MAQRAILMAVATEASLPQTTLKYVMLSKNGIFQRSVIPLMHGPPLFPRLNGVNQRLLACSDRLTQDSH